MKVAGSNVLNFQDSNKILGEDSCKVFHEGVNSVAMRWVMYREALSLFKKNLLFGVGATQFGEYSCVGSGWYPHSTILQSFSELGMLGGVMLIFTYILAAYTLLVVLKKSPKSKYNYLTVFILSLFILYLVAEQVYGNYLMSTGTWFLLGVISSIRNIYLQGNAYD